MCSSRICRVNTTSSFLCLTYPRLYAAIKESSSPAFLLQFAILPLLWDSPPVASPFVLSFWSYSPRSPRPSFPCNHCLLWFRPISTRTSAVFVKPRTQAIPCLVSVQTMPFLVSMPYLSYYYRRLCLPLTLLSKNMPHPNTLLVKVEFCQLHISRFHRVRP